MRALQEVRIFLHCRFPNRLGGRFPSLLLITPHGWKRHCWTRFPQPERKKSREKIMLETIAIILIVLWLLGMVSSYTVGGFIHVLLVAAIIIFLVRIIQGRRPL
jgi:hypothetical protein